MGIVVQQSTFDPGTMFAKLHAARSGVGAVVGFAGYVRDFNDGEEIAGMLLEHYAGMTEKALQQIVDEANERWRLLGVDVLHRVGRLEPGEPIVFVGVRSTHRTEAFEACHFIIDYLKTRAPFWKKEDTAAGPRWVDAREVDERAMERWR